MSWARALVAVPSRLVLSFFWLTFVVYVAIMLGEFRPPVVLGSAGLVLVLTWRMGPTPLPVDRGAVGGAAAALVLAGLWVLVELPLASEVLLVQRDPGFLTLEGIWLSEHADPSIPLRTALDAAAQVPGASVVSDAFWQDGASMHSQGATGVPGLLGIGGWLAGLDGVLAANVVIGGLALLAVYDVARRLMGPMWGLLPVVALALTSPFGYFSRTPFTEPTTIVLAFGGIAVLWGAFADVRPWRFGLAGALVGACALARIDGAAGVAGLILGVGLVASGQRDPARRRLFRRGLAASMGAALSMVLLGYLDLRVNSAGYLADHARLYSQLIVLLVASAVGAVALEASTRSPRVTAWMARNAATLGRLSAGTVIVGAVVLASRPLWMEAHWFEPGSSYAQFIAANQEAAGVTVDGTRSYDEMTLAWLAWYLGVPSVVLGVAGAAGLLGRSIRERRPELLAFLATVGLPSLLYVLGPRITPDHIWAMRRFLPVAIPALLLCAAWVLAETWRARSSRLARAAVATVGAVVLLFPVRTWGSLFTAVEYGGRRSEVAALCDAVAGRPVVVARPSGPPLLPTLRVVCDVDAIEVPRAITPDDLAAAGRAWPGRDVLVASFVPEAVPWQGQTPAPSSTTPMQRWPHSINRPAEPVRFTSDLWLGLVDPTGSVTPLTSGGA